MSAYIKNTERSQINDLMLHAASQTPRKNKSKPNPKLAEREK
jgi:hypothetical protein